MTNLNHSTCCNETVRVGGEGSTHYYICNACNKPCDIPYLWDEKDRDVNLLTKQRELIDKFWPKMLDLDNRQNATNIMVLSMIGELSELMEGYQALPWKPKREEREYILEEITDLLHFLLELYLIWGVTDWAEVVDRYLHKRSKNVTRGQIHQKNSNDLK